ncbi:MAG: FHA domain-containing protein [Myxococcota bacterium]
MATLKQVDTGAVRPVPSRMVVGRAASCALCLDDKHVSGEHATLAWNGSGWVLRDLGSRNGTFVDGERLEPGSQRSVAKGASLGFGRTEGFVLVDDGAPAALAEDPSGKLVIAEDGLLALPDAASPEVVVYADSRGGWVAERGDEVGPVADGESVLVQGRPWTVRLPASLEGTATMDAGPTLDTVKLRFAVSMDEEHVELTVVHRGRETPLEAREHGYILLTLARARLADAGLPLAEQGWLDRDQLLKMLGMDSNSLNVGIYRARGQLGAAGVEGAAAVVQVRRGQRRFGIEPDRFEVTSL